MTLNRWRLDSLPEYGFARLRALLDHIEPGAEPLFLSIGEPKHPFPAFICNILRENEAAYGKYPPNNGPTEFRQAVQSWLTRRYALPDTFIDADKNVQPLNGTREGLFDAALAFVPPQEEEEKERPAVLIPNPFYQCYAAAALAAGADPIFVPATKDTGFLPDFRSVDRDTLSRTAALYMCSPANPQGSAASLDYWSDLLDLAQTHDFALIADECYAEIYDRQAPTGLLQAIARSAEPARHLDRALVFHSLSKRSSLPGLRSGFTAGGAEAIHRLRQLRAYGGAPSPLPVYAAAAAAWSDETHVEENRRLYREKFDLAESLIGDRLGFYRPDGGFFLWLDVATIGLDGEAAALRLWQEAGLRVMPGAYFARQIDGINPGADYIRIALVHELGELEKALTRVNQILR